MGRPLGTFARAAGWAVLLGLALAQPLARADGPALRTRYAELGDSLRDNAFRRPLHIASSEAGDMLRGEVHAVLDHPYPAVRDALSDPRHWCDILILPFNTKYCHAVNGANGPALLMRIGRKYDQPVDQAYRLEFAYRGMAAGPDYFESRLNAKQGPLGTRDYRIEVSAVPIEGNRTFMRLNYSYAYGLTGRLAMQAYLSTVGADKIGFTMTGRDGGGRPVYIDGVRGAVERNAMRYYLAIDSFLDSLAAPQGRQVEQRIQAWFDATERYPRQLREMDRPTYVGMKRQEVERQQTLLE